jgi:16S rRNA (guanine527-N7)-methyltransferase
MRELAESAQTLLGIRITQPQLAALKIYESTLLDWNSRFNLTAIDEPDKVRVKHFLDSLTCLIVMRDSLMDRIVDIGSGAGFPGLPLKIICPAMNLTLVESVGKKVDFCRHLVYKLGLEEVEVIQERAERLGQDVTYREQYDWALARAVAKMPVLVEYMLPLVRVGGGALAMKGESAPAEAHAAEDGITMLGGHLRQLVPVTLPGVVDERYLVVVDKVAATPGAYPRRVGVPAKRPL